jgi:HAMP domain-containing protein
VRIFSSIALQIFADSCLYYINVTVIKPLDQLHVISHVIDTGGLCNELDKWIVMPIKARSNLARGLVIMTESPGHEVALSRLTSKLDSASTMHMIKPMSARYRFDQHKSTVSVTDMLEEVRTVSGNWWELSR